MPTNEQSVNLTYSAREQRELDQIREHYDALSGTENLSAEQIRSLDAKANRQATSLAIAFGIGVTLILGLGMSLVLVWKQMAFGVIVGCIGITGMALTPLWYTRMLARIRETLALRLLENRGTEESDMEDEHMSKIADANEKIAKGVTEGFEKIENGVVGGYQAIEHGVVGGFEKISDKFVDTFLAKNGESVEEAKARLAREQAAREEAHRKHMEELGIKDPSRSGKPQN